MSGTMSFDWSSSALAKGLECYRSGEFFEAHEQWESVWLACEEPEKTFLQALIQIAAAFHHLRRENPLGTASLLRGALRKLGPYANNYGGVAVDSLRESISAWLAALDHGEKSPHLPVPQIR
jgi:uncharacterized protein